MKLRSVARVVVVCLAALGLVGVGAHAVFTTSTTSGQAITAGTWGTIPPPTIPTTPTVTIAYPVNNTTYGADWTGAITGTVSDALGSITELGVSLQQGSGGCWTGSDATFTATCPNWVPVTTGTTSWSLTLPAIDLTSGDSYNATAQAQDSVGNTFASSTVAFTYNTAAPALPTVAISYPVNGATYGADWTGAITGTAAANAAGASISTVAVSIQQGTGDCWTGSGNTYTASCPNPVPVTSDTTSWSLTFPPTDLTSGDFYSVTAQATDSLGNLGTSSLVTFAYNTTIPTVVVTYPVNGTHYDATSWTGTITGTASSNSGGSTTIASVSVAIEDTTTGTWWNGTSFSATTQTFVPVTSGTTTWFLTFAASNLTSGNSYSVVAQAPDSAGNVGTSPMVTFSYCNQTSRVPPTVTITFPVNGTTYGSNWTGEITGIASSNAGVGTTIKSTAVAIEDTTTKQWWNGTSFTNSSQTFVTATGKTTWYLPLGATSLTSGNSYSVVAQATDSTGETGTSSTVTFTYAPLPTVTITFPANCKTYDATTWTGEITGTATPGAATTLKSVSVAIEDTTTKLWWNGTSFSATTETFFAANGTATWYLPFAAGNLTSGHKYAVVAEATDSDGNVGTSPTVSFTYCNRTTPPTVAITYPVNNATYGTNWTGEVTGTASAEAGATITSVSVAFKDTKTGKWWNGSAFGAGTQTFVTATGKTTWMLAMAAQALTSGVSYTAVAQATDSVGNTGTSSTVSFTYDTAPPTVVVTYPVNNTTYGTNWTGTIAGTASSNSGSSLSSTKVAIKDASTGKWWNGTGFSASGLTFVVASGTTSWSLGLAAKYLTSGATYTVTGEATDALGNVGTSSTVTFTYSTKSTSHALGGSHG
ncbi:MAG: Ig-like domain-containing protein [Acidimicrobiales bacterium]|jgi:hypothetical protein